MKTLTQFVLDDPRGDFIEDLIEADSFEDPKTRDELLAQVRWRRGCPEAALWAEYEAASLLPRC